MMNVAIVMLIVILLDVSPSSLPDWQIMPLHSIVVALK
jgi:hypothetical protein